MSGGTPDSGRYYRNSEEVPLGGGVLAIACGAAVASVLATVYAQLLNPNNFPSAELNVLATCAFGAGIGWAIRVAAVQGNIRSQSFPRIVGGLIGIGALYLSWVSYVSAVVPDGIPAGSAVYNPVVLAGIVADIAREGVWVVERWHPTGAQLCLIWTVEAALVVLLATVVAGSSRRPFCEACQCWTEKTEPVMLAYRRQDKLAGLLEAGTYELLEALRRWPVNPEKLSLGRAPLLPALPRVELSLDRPHRADRRCRGKAQEATNPSNDEPARHRGRHHPLARASHRAGTARRTGRR